MYGILAKNRGMWGCSSLCKRNGETIRFNTEEEAQKVCDEYNANRPVINNFTYYFVVDIDKEGY